MSTDATYTTKCSVEQKPKHPVPTGLLARYVTLGDEGYVLWCGPKETAELLEKVAALEVLADLMDSYGHMEPSAWDEKADHALDTYRAAFPKP